jgi:hypothetical protein
MSKHTFVAVTTTNPRYGWYQVATGTDKAKLEDEAARKIAGNQWDTAKDICTQTELTNLRVVSKTDAKREYHVDVD